MMWLVYALLSACTWGIATIFMRLAIERVDSTTATIIRTIMMGAMFLAFSLFSQNISKLTLSNICGRDWLYIGLGAITSCIAWIFYFDAFKYGNVSKVVSVDRLSFVFIIFMSALIFDEPLTKKMLMGAGIIVLGVLLVASK